MIKIVCILAVVSMAAAGLAPAQLAYAQPAVHYAAAPVLTQSADFDPHPQYNYGYSVQDALTGDAKSHTESRDGDVVRGSYSLVEADGSIRTVTYSADDVHGFNAIVDRQAPQIAVAKVHHAVPAVATYAAPIAHSAPVYSHAAPAYAHAVPAYAARAGPGYGHAGQVFHY